MLHLQTILNRLTGKEIVDTLVNTMKNTFEDFQDVQHRYIQAMRAIQTDLGEEAVNKEKEAICQQIASTLLFSGLLGLTANLRYFLDPVGGEFPGG